MTAPYALTIAVYSFAPCKRTLAALRILNTEHSLPLFPPLYDAVTSAFARGSKE